VNNTNIRKVTMPPTYVQGKLFQTTVYSTTDTRPPTPQEVEVRDIEIENTGWEDVRMEWQQETGRCLQCGCPVMQCWCD